MKNVAICLLIGLVILCGLSVALMWGTYLPGDGEAVQPDKPDAAVPAVVSDESATKEHTVMKPAVPEDDEQQDEPSETTKPDESDPDSEPSGNK